MDIPEVLEELISKEKYIGVFVTIISRSNIVLTEMEHENEEKKRRHLKTIRNICDEKLENFENKENKTKNKMIG